MRKELYQLLCRELGMIDEIKHIDLWNRNVEFIEQEEGWERPAVFVEFGPIEWKPVVNGVEYRAEPQVTLHIVTDWEDGPFKEEALKMFDLPDKIHKRLANLEGETFGELDLARSLTCHDHEEIVETIEVYQYVAIKRLTE